VTTDEPRPLSSSLDRVLRSLKAPDTRATGAVFGRWEEIVGARVAAHARPVKLEDGRLVVEVDDPAWATQLRFLEADLVTRLSEAGGLAVTSVDVRVARR
jgi:predicted nucleic acid-binding Zn ribbon protein